jgi:copper homeostasis protein
MQGRAGADRRRYYGAVGVSRVLLEICVDSADGLASAVQGGADRIELCSALELGGLTPSPGLMAIAAEAAVPVYAMIRPRAGSFVFSAAELDQMRHDVDAARAAGLAGVVLGVSLENGALDEGGLMKLKAHASGLGTTLHRAIDLVPDLLEAVDVAAGLNFERILSSGGKKTAMEGIEGLAAMIERTAGRISVMPGSGVNAGNAGMLLARLVVTEAHGSCSVEVAESDAKAQAFGFSAATRRVTSATRVAALRAALNQENRVTK